MGMNDTVMALVGNGLITNIIDQCGREDVK